MTSNSLLSITLDLSRDGCTTSANPRSNQNHSNIFAGVLTLIYGLVLLVGLVHHEMWVDEFQAWLIARDSNSLLNLIQNVRYEGCPPLWHLCLSVITQFTHNPFAMQLFHALIAMGCVYLVARYAPFSWYAKLMFPFGYFVLFEYGLISRSYALGNLLLFGFCALFSLRPKSYFLSGGLLLLLASTSAYGIMLATALGLGLIAEQLFDKSKFEYRWRLFKHLKPKLLFGLVVLSFSLAVAASQLQPPEDGYLSNWHQQVLAKTALQSSTAIRDLTRATGAILYAYTPVPTGEYHFWETSVFRPNFFILPAKLTLVSIAVFGFFLICFSTKRIVLVSYVVGTLSIIAFSFLVYTGATRHFGQLYTLLVACFWLAPFARSHVLINEPISFAVEQIRDTGETLLVVMMALHMVYGVYAYAMDYRWPFSQSKALADYLLANGLDKMPIVAAPDRTGTGLCALLDRKVWHIETGKLGSFATSRQRQILRSKRQFIDGTEKFAGESGHSVLLLVDKPYLKNNDWSMKVTFLQDFQGSILHTEDRFLYLASPRK